jgi:hypothetical protein
MDERPTFEETYPKYEFSELVRMGIALGASLAGLRRRAQAPRPDPPLSPARDNQLRPG